jgi:hypothetical protein
MKCLQLTCSHLHWRPPAEKSTLKFQKPFFLVQDGYLLFPSLSSSTQQQNFSRQVFWDRVCKERCTLALNQIRNQQMALLAAASCWTLPWFTLKVWTWNHYIPPKSLFTFDWQQSSVYYMRRAGFLLGLFSDPEDVDGMLLRNVGWLLTDYTALWPRREDSS